MPAQALTHNPAAYLRTAFEALNWPGLAFDDAMRCPARRDIIEFIATRWPARPMENIVSISKIDWLATDAARRSAPVRQANPYPEHSAAGGLFAKSYAAEQARLALAATQQAASVYTDD